MTDWIYQETELFAVCLLLGAGLAMIYDGFRILRLLFRHGELAVDLEDLAFWVFTAWAVFRTLFRYNRGALRGYAFIGMFLGVVLYTLTLSRLLLFGVKTMLPYIRKCQSAVRRPFVRFGRSVRNGLKNMAAEVKMASKSR